MAFPETRTCWYCRYTSPAVESARKVMSSNKDDFGQVGGNLYQTCVPPLGGALYVCPLPQAKVCLQGRSGNWTNGKTLMLAGMFLSL